MLQCVIKGDRLWTHAALPPPPRATQVRDRSDRQPAFLSGQHVRPGALGPTLQVADSSLTRWVAVVLSCLTVPLGRQAGRLAGRQRVLGGNLHHLSPLRSRRPAPMAQLCVGPRPPGACAASTGRPHTGTVSSPRKVRESLSGHTSLQGGLQRVVRVLEGSLLRQVPSTPSS